jgi:hypothetical protein
VLREMEGLDEEIDNYLAGERHQRVAPGAAVAIQTAWRARGPRLLFIRCVEREGSKDSHKQRQLRERFLLHCEWASQHDITGTRNSGVPHLRACWRMCSAHGGRRCRWCVTSSTSG